MSEYKDTTNRHLRHKLQSLGRRLDELEEASSKLQKAEEELMELQDKIIQAEGSNSSLLSEVETLRKRVLKIEGKDEEIRKAEDLCRSVRERLEEDERVTKGLKVEVERLQGRMAEMEKLEEAFGKCKSDCSQLCLNLNEERNLNRKLSTELEALKVRLKEVDTSEARLDKAEQALSAEMDRLKGLTQTFLSERKRLLDKQKEDEKVIHKLQEKLEQQKNRISSDYVRRESRDLRIEDELSTGLTSKLTRKKSFDYLKFSEDTGLMNKTENEKNSLEGQEDNKVRDLNQEVEKLKNRLKQLELVEEDLKNTESKNTELLEKFQQEKIKSQSLAEQVQQLKTQIHGSGSSHGGAGNGTAKVLENGKVESEDVAVRGFRNEKPKYPSSANPKPLASKHKREVSPQQRKEAKPRNKDFSHSAENSPKATRRAMSPAHKAKRGLRTGATPASDNGLRETARGAEEKPGFGSSQGSNSDSKKMSVLSRYPPAANDQKPWKTPLKATESDAKKKFSKLYVGSDSESNSSDGVCQVPVTSCKVVPVHSADKDPNSEQGFGNPTQDSSAVLSLSKANGSFTAYRSQVSPVVVSEGGSEGHSSASESESTGSRPSVGDQESIFTSISSSRSSNPRYPRYSRIQSSDGSSTRSSYDEEGHRALMAEGGSVAAPHQEPSNTVSGIEIRRVCSPREALRSKAVIKPAIVESDRKEVMGPGSGSGMEPTMSLSSGKPKISTKPNLTSKMTSSITIYPNDPSSSRTSSRSSSACSEPIVQRERHTSTSNIIIGPSSTTSSCVSAEHRGSVSIPYEISIPKSEITIRPCQDGGVDDGDPPNIMESARMETHVRSRSNYTMAAPPDMSDFSNDGESGFESSSSNSTTTVTSWRSHGLNHHPHHHHHYQQPPQHHQHQHQQHQLTHHSSQDEYLPEMRNITVRSTWKKRGALSVDDVGHSPRLDAGSEDELDPPTWRAYRATTVLDAEELAAPPPVPPPPPPSHAESRGEKLSPAEVYMRRITNREALGEPGHRVRAPVTPTSDGAGLGRTVPHEPVSAKERQPRSWKHAAASADESEPQPASSWRRQTPTVTTLDSYDRPSRTADPSSSSSSSTTPSGRSAGLGSGRTVVGRTPERSRPWSTRQHDN
ncbi:leucine zipper protein 1 [Engraulis encrasicolus]|uniref:leucine zipper protein 1 n=1 Tax=Engraulis encrasicolus TaxID=184585 RepID=UPI002FD2B138